MRGKSDLDLFFWPAAQTAVAGHPLLIYSTNTAGAGPFANGPIGLIPILPVAALANALGWASNPDVRTFAVEAVFALLSVPMAAAAVSLIQRGRGIVEWRVAAFSAFLLAPTLWVSVADYGHGEQPIELALVLFAVGSGLGKRWSAAALFLGLALLTRTTAVLYVVPLALTVVVTSRARWTARLLLTTCAAALAGILPFVIADGGNVLHSLITFRGKEPVGGGSVWVLTVGTTLSGLAQHLDAFFIIGTAILVCGVVLWRRREAGGDPAGLCGLLAIAATCFPLFAKTVYPYYLLEPYVFATIWWLARPGLALNWRMVVPALLVADAVMGQVTGLSQTGLGEVEGVVSSALLAGVIALLVIDLLRPQAVGRPIAQRAAVSAAGVTS